MQKLSVLVLGVSLLTGCSQFTTSKQEQSALAATAGAQGDAYVSCVTQNALGYTGQNSGEIGTVMTVATAACQSALDSFKAAQNAYLKTRMMRPNKALEESVAALNERAKADIAQQLVNKPAQPGAPAVAAATVAPAAVMPPAPAGVTPSAPVSSTAAPGAAAPAALAGQPAGGWTAQQRIYLDCMADQGRKYSGVNESATVVADVAQSRCRLYLGQGNAALEQEGRALVMGEVLDAKLAKPGR